VGSLGAAQTRSSPRPVPGASPPTIADGAPGAELGTGPSLARRHRLALRTGAVGECALPLVLGMRALDGNAPRAGRVGEGAHPEVLRVGGFLPLAEVAGRVAGWECALALRERSHVFLVRSAHGAAPQPGRMSARHRPESVPRPPLMPHRSSRDQQAPRSRVRGSRGRVTPPAGEPDAGALCGSGRGQAWGGGLPRVGLARMRAERGSPPAGRSPSRPGPRREPARPRRHRSRSPALGSCHRHTFHIVRPPVARRCQGDLSAGRRLGECARFPVGAGGRARLGVG